MRTTIILDDSLVTQAREMSGITRISDLVRKALAALIVEEARKRLASFGGTDPEASAPPRRYDKPSSGSPEAAEQPADSYT